MTAAAWSILLGTAGFFFAVLFVLIFAARAALQAVERVPDFGWMHLLTFAVNAAAVGAGILTLGLVAAGLPDPWGWLGCAALTVAGVALIVRAHRRRYQRVLTPVKHERHYWKPADVLPEDHP